MASTSSSVFAKLQPIDSATRVYRNQIENNPTLSRALHEHESYLEEQGRTQDIDPSLISTVVRHNSRGANIRPVSKKGMNPPGEDPLLASIQNTAVLLGEAKKKLQQGGVSAPTDEQVLNQYAAAYAKDPKIDASRMLWTHSWVKAGTPYVDLTKPPRDLRENDQFSKGMLDEPLSFAGEAERELEKGSRTNIDAGPLMVGQSKMSQVPVSDKTIELLLKFEPRGGQGKKYNPKPEWPGESSGVTIGIGYDIGQNSRSRFLEDWSGMIPDQELKRLSAVTGVKGAAAKKLLSSVEDIEVPWETAMKVFRERTLPRYIKETLEAYPGADKLSPDELGALVAMTMNRGTAFYGDTPEKSLRYLEKRQIRDAVSRGDFASVPKLIRDSKRVWKGSDIERGMARRRDAEAELFEKGLKLRGVTIPAPREEKSAPVFYPIMHGVRQGLDRSKL